MKEKARIEIRQGRAEGFIPADAGGAQGSGTHRRGRAVGTAKESEGLAIERLTAEEGGAMETRILDRTLTVWSTDGQHSETFIRGERLKNICRIGKGVIFEPVSNHHIAGTYAMSWSEFQACTTAVREAQA